MKLFTPKVFISAVGLVACLLLLTGAKESPYNILAQSVVRLRGAEGGGTGFLINRKDGSPLTVTAWHVCRGSTQMVADRSLEFSDVPLKVLAFNAATDICFLEPAPGVALRIAGEPSRFENVFMLGHPRLNPAQVPSHGEYVGPTILPYPFPPTPAGDCESGLLPALDEAGKPACIQLGILMRTTLDGEPGSSGSPVVNADAAVVGIMTSLDQLGALYTPSQYLRDFLEHFDAQ